jgi:hypothetical protein
LKNKTQATDLLLVIVCGNYTPYWLWQLIEFADLVDNAAAMTQLLTFQNVMD